MQRTGADIRHGGDCNCNYIVVTSCSWGDGCMFKAVCCPVCVVATCCFYVVGGLVCVKGVASVEARLSSFRHVACCLLLVPRWLWVC